MLLTQKRPTHWSAKHGSKRHFMANAWNSGPEFYLKSEVPGAEDIPSEDAEGNRYFVKATLQLIEDDDPRWVNPLYVTKGEDGSLMLHYEEVPTRMRDSQEYKMRKTWKSSIKKNGRKWTSWRGHFRVKPFAGSENVCFDDERPRKVIVITKNIRYFIAYKDKDRKEFSADMPLIAPSESGFSDKKSALAEQQSMIKSGYLDVIIFEADIDNMPEKINWNYVRQNRII